VTVVAVHQPTFLPWLGWWDKLIRADVFVLLDDVQYPKKGGSWMNRVRILSDGAPRWVTVPVDRAYHGVRSVREMRIDDTEPWRDRVEATIRQAYRAASHVDVVLPVIHDALRAPTERIATLDESAIRMLAGRLELDTSKLVHQSELGVVGTGTDLLVQICRAAGGDAYLSGDGADGYLEEQPFAEAGVELRYQGFLPPVYPQPGVTRHVAGLSLVDAAMNCGWAGTRALLVS
jgi:WbqC-like protein family